MQGELLDDRVLIRDESQAQRLIQKGFGVNREGVLELSLLEALFLFERNSLEAVSKGTKVDRVRLIKASGNEEDFQRRYKVYKDLREKGYVVKTGFKYGAHFRVYERGEFSQEGHSALLVHVVPEDAVMSFPELSRAVRLTQSVKKRMLFAVLDHEGDITYYQVDRVLP